jgi:hypothetical protein
MYRIVLLALGLHGCVADNYYKYQISTGSLIPYYTDTYTQQNGCIEFYAYNKKQKFCEDYQIYILNEKETR